MILCTKKHPADKNTDSFFRRNLFVLLSFLVPAVIMAVLFALKSVFPFGNRMFLISDGWHQYFPFLTEYQHLIKEGSSLAYSWNTGGGVNFWGVVANYVASPLYIFAALLPSGSVWLVLYLTFTVVVRVGLAGMFFAIFIRKVFSRNDISLVTFGAMYALCAFTIGYHWNTMWLDTFALLPLVIAGVVEVLRDKKFTLYIIALTVSVISSFYIGYMVCLFVLIFSICYTIVSFVSIKESLKNAGRMVLYTGIAFMMTAFITIPAFLAVSGSDSAGSAADFPTKYTINYGFNMADNGLVSTLIAFAKTITNMLSANNPITMDKGSPNVACGILAIVLLPFYFATKKICLKEKLVSLFVILFLTAGFVVNQLNYIWHAFATPAMVYYRWSFIFSFAMLVIAYRAYMLIECINKKTMIISSAFLMIYLASSFFLQKKLSVLFTAVGVVVVLLGFVLYKKSKIRLSVLSILLCAFTICDLAVSGYIGVTRVGSTNLNAYPKSSESVDTFTEYLYGDSEEIFRTEFIESQTLNDGALNSVYGITTFNSMVDSSYADVLKELGLAASMVNNRYVYYESTPVTNLFLNIKYLIGRDGQKASDADHLDPLAVDGNSVLYENKYYVPMGFMAQSELLSYDRSKSWRFPADVLQEMFSKATGIEEDVFTEIEPVKEIEVEHSENLKEGSQFVHSYKYNLSGVSSPDGKEADTISVEYEIKEDGSYYGLFRSSSEKKVKITVNDDADKVSEVSQPFASFISVGTLKKGDKVRVEMYAKYGESSSINYRFTKINDDVFSKGVEKLRESTMEVSQWDDTSVKGTINVKEDGLFYTSILYCDGWKAYVDGKEVEITPVADTFVAFELTKGEHEITLQFETPGLKEGIVVSFIGLGLFILLLVASALVKKKKALSVKTSDVNEKTEDLSDFSEESTELSESVSSFEESED